MLDTLTLSKAGTKGGKAPKHYWTEEEKAIVRRDYQGTSKSAEQIANLLSYITGKRITFCAVKGQIALMGIAHRKKPWTLKEEDRLRGLIPLHPIYKIAKTMGRSKNSIRVKATRLGLSTQFRDGWFTKAEVSQILGVDHKKVQKWIDTGALKASWHGETKPQMHGGSCWHITSQELRAFLQSHAVELTGRNVDLFMIVELLTGNSTPRSEE